MTLFLYIFGGLGACALVFVIWVACSSEDEPMARTHLHVEAE